MSISLPLEICADEIAPSPTIAMERARRIDLTSALTPSVTACGLMKTNAWCFENFGVSSNGSPPTFCAILSIGPMSMSSKVSKSDCDAPSTSTCGSFVHESSVGFLTPAAISASAVSSSSTVPPSQLRRSDSPSNGDAEPCTPLSPTSGFAARPSSCHRAHTCSRIEPDCAFSGSVAPSTDARNSAHESAAASHCTT